MGNCNNRNEQSRCERRREAVGLFCRIEETERQLLSLKEQLALVMNTLQTVQMLAEQMFPKELAEYKVSLEKGRRK